MERVRLCLERKLLYKKILYLLLVLGILALSGSLYYAMWSSVPSTIMLKADMDQELNLKVPASGELYREPSEETSGNGIRLNKDQYDIWYNYVITHRA